MQLVGSHWSEGVDVGDSPHRGAVSAGLELSTTLWSRTEGGAIHTLAPFISISGDLWTEAGEGDPIPRNQNMALRAISDKNLENIWYVQPGDDAGAPRTYGVKPESVPKDQMKAYRVQFLRLLRKLCLGGNNRRRRPERRRR